VIFGHVLDAHEFHFFSYKGKDGQEHHATIPLPIILYSSQKGLSVFSSSRFEHGHASYDGYKLVGNDIVPVDKNVKVYDLSLTRNVVQMFIALALLVLIMSSIAKKYRTGKGVTTAPSGFQNAIEPVITFVREWNSSMMFLAIFSFIRKEMKFMGIQNVSKNHLLCIKFILAGIFNSFCMYFFLMVCFNLRVLSIDVHKKRKKK
jgi:hypothetical protein